MRDGITKTVVALIVFVVVALIMVASFVVGCIVDAYGEFEYTTASGEKGTATYCEISYGSAHCTAEDGTKLIVESFRKVK